MLLFKDNRKFILNEKDVELDVERVLQLCVLSLEPTVNWTLVISLWNIY